VRVKPSVTTPKYKWGSVTHRSVGAVKGDLELFYYLANARFINSNVAKHAAVANWFALTFSANAN